MRREARRVRVGLSIAGIEGSRLHIVAGPAAAAICHEVELQATALGNADSGTKFGISACDAGEPKARAVPIKTGWRRSKG